MTDNNLKHLLFYSNYCNFSNEIYQTIIKYNLKDDFHLLNISKTKYNIPSIITSVPTLLLNDKKTLYQNDDLEQFIQELYKKNQKVMYYHLQIIHNILVVHIHHGMKQII